MTCFPTTLGGTITGSLIPKWNQWPKVGYFCGVKCEVKGYGEFMLVSKFSVGGQSKVIALRYPLIVKGKGLPKNGFEISGQCTVSTANGAEWVAHGSYRGKEIRCPIILSIYEMR
jgi:hypothetical protein